MTRHAASSFVVALAMLASACSGSPTAPSGAVGVTVPGLFKEGQITTPSVPEGGVINASFAEITCSLPGCSGWGVRGVRGGTVVIPLHSSSSGTFWSYQMGLLVPSGTGPGMVTMEFVVMPGEAGTRIGDVMVPPSK